MAWMGYYEFDGTEVINVARTEAYAYNLGFPAFRPVFRNTALAPMLGDGYGSPMTDEAPWHDPDQYDSRHFIGVYPLDVVGMEDSTVTANVTESVLDGGVVNRARRGTRTVVFSAVLLGLTDAAVEYGLRWLRMTLQGAPCGNVTDCRGSTVCYLSSEPTLPINADDPAACLEPLLRSLLKVTVTNGPTVTSKQNLSSGGTMWTVQWTMVAGWPFEFMVEKPLVQGFTTGQTNFYVNTLYPESPSWYDVLGTTTEEYNCVTASYNPLFDPACPLVSAPPAVPRVPVACFQFPTQFTRVFFTIPKAEIPLWGQAVPKIEFVMGLQETRNLRLRFYADVMETGDPLVDPCSYCGDIVFSYLPAGATFIFDGVERAVTALTPGNPARRADAVVFKSDGTPFEWPELTCGFGYLVTIDVPIGQPIPQMNMSLVGKVA